MKNENKISNGVKILFAMAILFTLWLSNYASAAGKNFSVDLLWEANTYTPSWYQGKALPVIQSQVKVTAIPYSVSTGVAIPPSKLVYEWFLNDKKNLNASGTGKRQFVFRINAYDDHVVNLKVSDQSGAILLGKAITLSVDRIKPKILFYEYNELDGARYNKALNKEIQLNDSEITINAEPYFFSRKDLEYLSYNWSINNQKAEIEKFPNSIFLKKGEGSGVSVIGLKVENTLNILQFAENFLRINF